jgi:small subunit ribosomal protein S1
MEDFEKALEQYDYQFAKGQVVKGRPVAYESDGALVDIGGKSPGFLPSSEAAVRLMHDLSVVVPLGEERDFLIVGDQDADGQVKLSIRQLELRKLWQQLQELHEASQSLQVRVLNANKGGVAVDVLGLKGFIPRSHLLERENLDSLQGQTLAATILELDRSKKKIILSHRLASRAESFSQLEVGQLIEGTVSGIRPFGLFVEFDSNTGLLHVTQISKKRVDDLAKLFAVGDTVRALITDLEASRNRISLATKFFEAYPGEMLEQPQQVMAEASDRYERARKLLMD